MSDIILQTGVNILWWDYTAYLQNWHYTNTCGNFWRLYWNSSPGAEIIIDGRIYPLEADKITVIPPFISYSTRSSRTFSHLAIHFLGPEYLKGIAGKIYQFSTDRPEFAQVTALPSLLQSKDLRPELKMMSMYELIFQVIRQFGEQDLNRLPKQEPDVRIIKLAQELYLHPENPPSNRELARRCYMSLNTFLRLFKKTYGMTPQMYSRIMRIEIARTLIWRNEQSLDDIARATGFSDRYHFSKVFKSVTHCTPAQYRKFQTLTSMLPGASLP